ncbi:TetR/AcrR family transcriptional regulator [Streptomyces sp. HNM0574]|uniref:TetR/AcrR family transcriptional regulator n=1 Tax=Streptomyces sp. HNM0574 TaxID=2714954 RepID=UPI00146F7D5B|nr:TetR/AcrR family transcriptional regulator [Streptomyces sp. HNM0574]NLU70284.1 TetR/AcrR family transcriptional regulator [Streptomyces sp. HNM0574]
MRRDAQRNRELILAAAREIYAEQGVEAPLDAVARRAGVGNATVYRRFPDRAALIEAVFHESLGATLERGEQARAAEDAWQGLADYLEYIFEGLALDKGANDLMTTGLSGVPSLERLREHHGATVGGLMARAQEQGTMREDVTPEDLLFSLAALGRAVPATAAVVPGAWRRHLALLLDGLRTPARADAGPLPAPPFTAEEFAEVMREMGDGAQRPPGR